MFAGALCYTDDLVLLAPCASALHRMLSICSSYARDHGLLFNLCKTKLICFRSTKSCHFLPSITFNNIVLIYSDEVIHLGHVLSFDLSDGPDVSRVLKDLNRKANCVLCILFILLTVISNVFLLNYIDFFFMVVVFGLLTQNF